MEQYLDEFDHACAAVAAGETLPFTGTMDTMLAIQALCFMANQARLNYALIRSRMEERQPQVGPDAFLDKLP